MSEWINVKDRFPPKDRTLFMSMWNEVPVFAAWVNGTEDAVYDGKYRWLFWSKPLVIPGVEAGYRVLMWSPRNGWGINGNCAPFNPTHWQPLPEPPTSDQHEDENQATEETLP